jgi:CHASE2 domain-containing sensor protein
MLKKRKFWVHCVIATAFIFGFMWTASKLFAIFDFLDPIGDALEGYEVTDQVFSNPQWREVPPADTSVILVNIGTQSRRVIAEQINMINNFNPRVIGLDTYFGVLKPDTLGDYMLADALANTPNLIMYAKLVDPDTTGTYWNDVIYCNPIFSQDHETASVNLINEEAGAEQFNFKTTRSFFPQELLYNAETGEMDTVLAFGVALAKRFAPEKVEKFLARGYEEELINYYGNVVDFGRTRLGTRYFALDWYQVLDSTMFWPELFKDKIVIMGFLGEDFDDTRSFEDKYFTPLNTKYTGRANPDMFGMVVHANIISMILNEQYLDQMTETQAILIAVLVCFLNVVLFSIVYHKIDNWYDGVTKLIQLMEALILTFVIILVFHYFDFKLNLTLTIIAVLFAGDTLEVYYGVIVNTWERIEKKWLTKST